MSFPARLLLALCIFAGMAHGMVHVAAHDPHDDCAAQHSHDSGDTHSHDNGGEKDAPHHHPCCHSPNANFAVDGISPIIAFQTILVEIPTEVPLVPDEPVFALDKPPLI